VSPKPGQPGRRASPAQQTRQPAKRSRSAEREKVRLGEGLLLLLLLLLRMLLLAKLVSQGHLNV
jgi:hypothetical protein